MPAPGTKLGLATPVRTHRHRPGRRWGAQFQQHRSPGWCGTLGRRRSEEGPCHRPPHDTKATGSRLRGCYNET